MRKFLKTKNMPIKIFSDYGDYFHDGGIENIISLDNEIVFEMQSSPIYTCDNRDLLPLSVDHTIYGLLHAKGIISIKKNDQIIPVLKMEATCINLITLELSDNRIFFVGDWVDYSVQPSNMYGTFRCEVIAKEIYWENTANITDPALLGKYMGLEGPPPYDYPQWYIDKYGPQGKEGESCPKKMRCASSSLKQDNGNSWSR